MSTFRYPFRVGEIWGTLWQKILDTADAQFASTMEQFADDVGLDANFEVPSQALSNELGGEVDRVLTMEEDRDRALEDFLSGLSTGGGGLRFATKVVAASNSLDTTAAHYDYVCTGTNDQATINSAINALGANGGRVLLMEGTYNISVPGGTGAGGVIMQNNVELCGMGPGTIIKAAAGLANLTNMISEVTQANNSKMVIRNLTIDGNSSNQAGNAVCGVQIQQNSQVDWTLEDLIVQNMTAEGINIRQLASAARIAIRRVNCQSCCTSSGTAAITVQGPNLADVNISDCQVLNVSGATSAGFYLDATRLTCTGCTADTVTYIGFYINQHCNYSTITACEANACADGFYLLGCGHVTLVGCTAASSVKTSDASTGNGFVFDSAADCVLADCVAAGNESAGFMFFSATSDCLLRDCIADSNSTKTNLGFANIELRSSATDCSVMGCISRKGVGANKASYGLSLDAASVATCIVINNDLKNGGTTGSFNDAGTGTVKNLDGSANNWNRL